MACLWSAVRVCETPSHWWFSHSHFGQGCSCSTHHLPSYWSSAKELAAKCCSYLPYLHCWLLYRMVVAWNLADCCVGTQAPPLVYQACFWGSLATTIEAYLARTQTLWELPDRSSAQWFAELNEELSSSLGYLWMKIVFAGLVLYSVFIACAKQLIQLSLFSTGIGDWKHWIQLHLI